MVFYKNGKFLIKLNHPESLKSKVVFLR